MTFSIDQALRLINRQMVKFNKAVKKHLTQTARKAREYNTQQKEWGCQL
jgi:hypothetical protein